MKIQQVTAVEVLPIRHQVLWPEKPLSFCSVEGDEFATHYGAFVDNQLVCVASIYINGREARLRKFATLPQYQGQGIGSKVLEHVMSTLQHFNVHYFWCDARTTALSFYQRFGLEVDGPEFEKSGIAYYKMSVCWRD
ncbi:GNAT family N-acetyltransferase [Vibrio olivae]|uniref:GNAT family N-acetyltransferase n=1 Tax=Vibrio olivae TaxID=1243002 RepID=A0ABV5HU28_9VIBR